MPRRPYIKFFTSDWLGDRKLRRCSRAAKGVMIDLMCLMNDSEQVGVMCEHGQPMTIERIVEELAGDDPEDDRRALDQLIDRGVLIIDDTGAVRCERMVKDARIYEKRASAGQKGGFAKANAKANATAKCSSRAWILGSGSMGSGSGRDKGGVGAKGMPETIYLAYPRHVAKARALKAIESAIREVAKRDEVNDPEEWLLERVRAFAASPAGQAGTFCPHPATWFNGGKYDDDPREWHRRNEAAKPPGFHYNDQVDYGPDAGSAFDFGPKQGD